MMPSKSELYIAGMLADIGGESKYRISRMTYLYSIVCV